MLRACELGALLGGRPVERGGHLGDAPEHVDGQDVLGRARGGCHVVAVAHLRRPVDEAVEVVAPAARQVRDEPGLRIDRAVDVVGDVLHHRVERGELVAVAGRLVHLPHPFDVLLGGVGDVALAVAVGVHDVDAPVGPVALLRPGEVAQRLEGHRPVVERGHRHRRVERIHERALLARRRVDELLLRRVERRSGAAGSTPRRSLGFDVLKLAACSSGIDACARTTRRRRRSAVRRRRRPRGSGSRGSRTAGTPARPRVRRSTSACRSAGCRASSTRDRRDRAGSRRPPSPPARRRRGGARSPASRRSPRRSRRRTRRSPTAGASPAAPCARRCRPRGVQVGERRHGVRAEHVRRRPRPIVEAGLVPADGIEPAVDVLDEVAFVVAEGPGSTGPCGCARSRRW